MSREETVTVRLRYDAMTKANPIIAFTLPDMYHVNQLFDAVNNRKFDFVEVPDGNGGRLHLRISTIERIHVDGGGF